MILFHFPMPDTFQEGKMSPDANREQGLKTYEVLLSRGTGKPQETTLKAKKNEILLGATFGDIILMKGMVDGAAMNLAMKDFRGNETFGIHSYLVHGALCDIGIPTFDFYALNLESHDQVIMPYIGTPDINFDQPTEGDEMCIGPMQMSKATKALARDGFTWSTEDLTKIAERLVVTTQGVSQKPIELSPDCVFFTLKFQNRRWRLSDMLIGDFDAINIFDEETGNSTLLQSKSRNALMASMHHLLSDFKSEGEFSIDTALAFIQNSLDQGKATDFTTQTSSQSDVSLDLGQVRSWKDL